QRFRIGRLLSHLASPLKRVPNLSHPLRKMGTMKPKAFNRRDRRANPQSSPRNLLNDSLCVLCVLGGDMPLSYEAVAPSLSRSATGWVYAETAGALCAKPKILPTRSDTWAPFERQ